MEQKLYKLFLECVDELNKIGIDILNEKKYGKIEISISKRNNKRYGCCKQYEKINKHYIEISKWVMELRDDIIKNTIMHELIHCMPYCNNHGKEFKKYANIINEKYNYNISRVGDKKKDFEKSNIEYNETKKYNYKIVCKCCKQEFYRQRLSKNFARKYRCAKCGGMFEISNFNNND